MLGNQSFFGLSTGNIVPKIQASETSGHWDIEINVSAGQITDAEALCPLQGEAPVSPFSPRVDRRKRIDDLSTRRTS